MSFEAQSNRILITDPSLGTTLDTNEKLMYIHSSTSFSFTIPSLPKDSGARENNYLVGTLAYPADYIIGSLIFNSGDATGQSCDANGSILASSIYDGPYDWLVAIRFLTLIVNGINIYANIRQENQSSDDNIPAQSFIANIYAGNYDL